MTSEFKLNQFYDHNLNFLFGSGASVGFLPTLNLNIQGDDGKNYTFETLAKEYEGDEIITALLFMLYYQQCIEPGLTGITSISPLKKEVIKNYKDFLKTLIQILNKQSHLEKKANIFTTNYDNCFEIAGEELMQERAFQFALNDGGSGFYTRNFHIKNFDNRIINRGIFGHHDQFLLPQINLLHAHGSIHWERDEKDSNIKINYGSPKYKIEFTVDQIEILEKFKQIIYCKESKKENLQDYVSSIDKVHIEQENFWQEYKKIPIVNPTKWKFHETVFEENYYQILRQLSYELERTDAVLIVFGFSFADEHILSIVQRALSNPSLMVYIICYSKQTKISLNKHFKEHLNVKFITPNEDRKDINFEIFNSTYFTIKNASAAPEVESGSDK